MLRFPAERIKRGSALSIRRPQKSWPGRRSVRFATFILLSAVAAALIWPPYGWTQSTPTSDPPGRLLDRARERLKEAKDLDARRHLSRDYQVVEEAVRELEAMLASGEEAGSDRLRQTAWQALQQSRHLANQARFVKLLRDQKEPWQEVADRFAEGLREIALAARVELPVPLAGSDAALALADSVGRRRVQQRVRADSLSVLLSHADRRCQVALAEQESILTTLRVEVRALRQQLWETELRAGMAEADRSAAEVDLNRRREREQAVRDIEQQFGPDEAEVLLTPAGDVIIRVFGFSFGVGRADLPPDMSPLLDKLTAAVGLFGGADLRIEGHTDNTGNRAANLDLSRRRADSVARLLAERLGWTPERIEIAGYGPDRPIATNDTPAGRAQNRRIDVVILTGGL